MDIADVKRELSGDEKVLESAFKLETLYKKYKFILWGVVIALIVFFAGRAALSAMHEAKLSEANQAFLTLQEKPDDARARAVLKEKNPVLFELFSYSQAAKKQDITALKQLSGSSNLVIADLSGYTAATLEKKGSNTKLYAQMALLEEAYLSLQAGKVNDAKAKLELIDERSSLATVAALLKHATVKAE